MTARSLRFERWIERRARNVLHFMRRTDPYYRPLFDRALREPIAAGIQGLINWRRPNEGLGLAEERHMPGEKEALDSIIADMGAYMRAMYRPGECLRAGNTKTHGLVKGEVIIRDDLPDHLRRGILAEPRTYKAWVRFSGPGPDVPADIDDVGFGSIAIKLMGVEGERLAGDELLDDEKHTQDLICVSTPTFVTPNIVENAKLQANSNLRGTPFMYFWRPGDTHILDFFMQGLWNETKTSPLESQYWSCVPYLLGPVQAMMYSVRPKVWTRTRIPNLPFRPPDNYLRDALLDTLAVREAEFDILVQVQTDPHRMPIENAAVRWPEKLSPWVPVATLRLPPQAPDWAAQLALAHRLSYNPWHCLADHRPLGNQSRARLRMYWELSRLRQEQNNTPHFEPTGDEILERVDEDLSGHDGRWEDQHGVTLYAAVRPEAVNGLKQELAAIQKQVETEGAPFSRSARIHFARFVFVPEAIDPDLGRAGPGLAYLGDFDGLRERHLHEIAHIAAAEWDRLSAFLEDPIPGNVAGRRRWLEDHIVPDATHYVNAIGRTVRQIRSEARLRDRIEQFLDSIGQPPADGEKLHRKIQDFVLSEPSLQWALKDVQDKAWHQRRTLVRIAIILAAVPLLVITLPLLVLWLFVIRGTKRPSRASLRPPSQPTSRRSRASRTARYRTSSARSASARRPGPGSPRLSCSCGWRRS